MTTLSVTIICMNEADRVRACLESVAPIADEIIVFDSGSDDDTVAICREFTPHVFVTDWPGFGAQRQRALEKARCEWVLSIDADERVSEELATAIRRVIATDSSTSVYQLKIAAIVHGEVLKHGRTTKYAWRLFRREGARYNDKRVHERLVPAAGKMRRLRGGLMVHETFRDYEHAMLKLDGYAWTWANERFAKGKRCGVLTPPLKALAMFLKCYFLKLGMLDRETGLILACQFAIYTFNKYATLWYLTHNRRD